MDKPPAIAPTDGTLDTERATAQAQQIDALKIQAQGDSASLMARYGTRLALANVAGTAPPLMALAAGKAA